MDEELADEELVEIARFEAEAVIGERLTGFCDEALRRAKRIGCFEFVPSNYRMLYRCLDALPRGRFCEWGSGIGIGVAIASTLGYDAVGIEINEPLVKAGRTLLEEWDITGELQCGSYYEIAREADYYFAYAWASTIPKLERHFVSCTPPKAQLLICDGAECIQQKAKRL